MTFAKSTQDTLDECDRRIGAMRAQLTAANDRAAELANEVQRLREQLAQRDDALRLILGDGDDPATEEAGSKCDGCSWDGPCAAICEPKEPR